MNNLSIIIVDDNEKFREGLKFFIENVLNHTIIGEANDGASFMLMPQIHLADIVLMDIEMPYLNGIEATKRILTTYKIGIIAITSYEDITYINELMEAGFKGCVLKKNIYENLNIAMQKVINGGYYYPKSLKIKINK